MPAERLYDAVASFDMLFNMHVEIRTSDQYSGWILLFLNMILEVFPPQVPTVLSLHASIHLEKEKET